MTRLFNFIILLTIFVSLISCLPDKNNVENMINDTYSEMGSDTNNIKEGDKFYSPDERCFARIIEIINDSTDSDTHVIVTFKSASQGVYRLKGINKGIKLFWKGNDTLVIETNKEYEATTKSSIMQTMDDQIKIEYIEK